MSIEENIAKLDALVKIIAPGIFALTVAMALLEVVVLMFRKVQMNHRGGVVSLISGVGVLVLKRWLIFFFISRLVIGCITIAFSNLGLSGMCGCSASYSSILFFTGAIVFSTKCVCFGAFILRITAHPKCGFLQLCVAQ